MDGWWLVGRVEGLMMVAKVGWGCAQLQKRPPIQPKAHLERCGRQGRGVAAAQLQHDRPLLGGEPEEPVRLLRVEDGLVHHHLGPQPGAAADEARQLAVVDVGPVHPGGGGLGWCVVGGGLSGCGWEGRVLLRWLAGGFAAAAVQAVLRWPVTSLNSPLQPPVAYTQSAMCASGGRRESSVHRAPPPPLPPPPPPPHPSQPSSQQLRGSHWRDTEFLMTVVHCRACLGPWGRRSPRCGHRPLALPRCCA